MPEQGPQHALDHIVESARGLLAQHGLAQESIAAIGVSCGSPLDRVKGIIQAPPNLSTWVDVPICRLLAEAFQTTCRLENDANAGAVAEHRFGAGRGAEHMVFLTLGHRPGRGYYRRRQLVPGGQWGCGRNWSRAA